MPHERPDAGTVKVELQFPEDQNFPFVSARPHAGWTHPVTKRTLVEPITEEGEAITEVVSRVTWEAESRIQIGTGEFDEFGMSVGPMPADAADLVFKAIQTYSSGGAIASIAPIAGALGLVAGGSALDARKTLNSRYLLPLPAASA